MARRRVMCWGLLVLVVLQTAVTTSFLASAKLADQAYLAHLQGELTTAEASYRGAVQLAPYVPSYRCALSDVLSQQGHPDEALAWARWVVRHAGHRPDGHRSLGEALLGAGRPQEALAEFRAGLAIAPHDGTMLLGAGRALVKLGEVAAGVTQLRAAHDACRHVTGLDSALGDALIAQNDLAATEDYYRALLLLVPANAQSEYRLGWALFWQQREQDAEVHFRRAVALDRRDTGAHLYLAYALAAQGQRREAEAEIAAAQGLGAPAALIEYARAMVAHKLRQDASALQAVRQSVLLDPWASGSYRLWLAISRGVGGPGTGGELVQRLRASLEARPDSPVLRTTLAAALVAQHEFAQALVSAEDPGLAGPGSPAPCLYRGLALAGLGRRTEALAELDTAGQLATTDKSAYRLLADAYLGIGEYEAARRAARASRDAGWRLDEKTTERLCSQVVPAAR